jgi:dCTP diphosphatase
MGRKSVLPEDYRNMKTLNIEKIQDELKTFAKARDWEQFHSVKNLAMALSVETSELVEIFQWMTEEQSNAAQSDPTLRSRAQDEIADVFVYLLRIATKLDIDLEEAVLQKMKKNEEKYPVELSKGSAKKYTEL